MATPSRRSTTPPRAPVLVDIDRLAPADSPRIEGEDFAHVRALAATAAPLPAILVHRATLRVIDGMHRVRAARLRGESRIAVRFYDGPAEAAFVLAVEANVAHGLPLSLAAREAAAARIVASHPDWSDRSVARCTGLSADTVAAIRGRSRGVPMPAARVGQDGRVRPVDIAAGRRRAAEVIARQPDASLRQIARAAGISVGTARDVRIRLRNGADPVPAGRGGAPEPGGGGSAAAGLSRPGRPRLEPVPVAGVETPRTRLESLRRDPALRYSEQGRSIVRWLDAKVPGPDDLTRLVDAIPPHSGYVVAEVALACARMWQDLAEELRRRVTPDTATTSAGEVVSGEADSGDVPGVARRPR